MWNAEIFDGDLLGVTVVDGSSGFPVGWAALSGGGERIYTRTLTSSGQTLPMVGVTYNDYAYVNNNHQLAIAVFTSDGRFNTR